MANPVLKEVECPICLETLRKPIRILRCGHNLCQACLIELCTSNQNKKCPSCRTSIKITEDEVEKLLRNRTVENMIDRLEDHQNQQSVAVETFWRNPHEILSEEALKNLKDIAMKKKEKHNWRESVQILQSIVFQVKGLYKVPLMVQKTECLLHMKEYALAKTCAKDIVSIVDWNRYHPDVEESDFRDECDFGLSVLAKQFLADKYFDTALLLTKCRKQLILKCYEGEMRLFRLESIGLAMQNYASELFKVENGAELHEQIPLMEEILEEMLNITDVDLRIKSKSIAWYLNYFGFACQKTGAYSKAILLHEQAIIIMKTAFGVEAKRYKVFGLCYHNQGTAFENLQQILEAKAAYNRAVDVKSSCCDWKSNEQKSESLSTTLKALDRL